MTTDAVRRRAGHGRRRPDLRDAARPAARGGVGVEIDVANVPQRETGMTPYEIMLSESQERMLLIVKRGREAEVERIFEKWDLHAVRIGEVTADGILRVQDRRHGRRRGPEPGADRRGAGLPPSDGAAGESRRAAAASATSVRQPLPRPNDALLSLARLADRREQAMDLPAVRLHGADEHDRARPGSGAGVVRVKGTNARAGDVASTATAGSVCSIRGRERGSRSPRRRATSRAPARRRSARRTASTSAIPNGPRSCGSSPRPWPGSARRAARSRFPSPAATSACTTRPTGARSCRRRSSASSGCSRTRRTCAGACFPRTGSRSFCWATAPASWAAAST